MADSTDIVRGSMTRNGLLVLTFEVAVVIGIFFINPDALYLLATAFMLIVSFVVFATFMLSFDREMPKANRPMWLIIVFSLVNLMLIILLFAYLYDWSGIVGDNCTSGDLFDAIYLSVITLTTVGYGDCHAVGRVGKAISASEALCGFVILGLLLSAIQKLFKPGTRASGG